MVKIVHLKFKFLTDITTIGTATGMVYIFNIGSPGGNKLNLSSILRPNTAFGPVRVIRFNLDGQVLVTGHDVGALEVFIFIFPHLFFLCQQYTKENYLVRLETVHIRVLEY